MNLVSGGLLTRGSSLYVIVAETDMGKPPFKASDGD
jgi:hypothetical protein